MLRRTFILIALSGCAGLLLLIATTATSSTSLKAAPLAQEPNYCVSPPTEIPDDSNPRCRTPTGHCIAQQFYQYWLQNGKERIFGWPTGYITCERNKADGKSYLVQWFERERLELHPENSDPHYRILLGLLGGENLDSWEGKLQSNLRAGQPADTSLPYYFADTKHAITNVFRSYWSAYRLNLDLSPRDESIQMFGYPITEPQPIKYGEVGVKTTQWFERARFEVHEENDLTNRILLGRLGKETDPNDPDNVLGPINDIRANRGLPPLQLTQKFNTDLSDGLSSRLNIGLNTGIASVIAQAQPGTPPLNFDRSLNASAQNHANYYLFNNQLYLGPANRLDPKQEAGGRQGFTGATVQDRAKAAGFRWASGDEITAPFAEAKQAVDFWLKDPQSLKIILNPNFLYLGYGHGSLQLSTGQTVAIQVVDFGTRSEASGLAGGAMVLPTSVQACSSAPYGVVGTMRWSDWGSFDMPAKAAAELGAQWQLEDFAWGDLEPTEGQFEFTGADRMLDALHGQNLNNVVGILSYSASWATSTQDDDGARVSFYAPDLNKYAAFLKVLVGRYKDRIHYWQVWNEPNSPDFWRPQPNANEYAELLKVAYRAVKEADPSAKVLAGAVTGNAVSYLQDMLNAGTGNSFDILAIHPYAKPVNEANGLKESMPEVRKVVEVDLARYRAFLQRNGLGDRPIWATEIGWPANAWQLNEQVQANYLAQAYAQMLSSCIAEHIFWYSFKDEQPKPIPAPIYGLIAWGGGEQDLSSRRPAFAAYATSARMLTGAQPIGRAQPGVYQVTADFEQREAWTRTDNPLGSFTISAEQRHSGSSSGRLEYNFTGLNQNVDFAPAQPRPLPGRPTRLGLWVRGDGSGNYISAWIRDSQGELFKVRLGSVTAATDGWRYYESRVANYYFPWEHTGGNNNGVVDYPVSFAALRMENNPDQPPGKGVIYVDDLLSFDGPDATVMRFHRSDGGTVDILWSVDATKLNLPTHSASAQVIDRDGGVSTVKAVNSALPLDVSSSPIYVVHQP